MNRFASDFDATVSFLANAAEQQGGQWNRVAQELRATQAIYIAPLMHSAPDKPRLRVVSNIYGNERSTEAR